MISNKPAVTKKPALRLEAQLSALWIVVLINILAADIFSFMLQGEPGALPVKATQLLMLVCAVVLEIPAAMIFLSRILRPRANRVFNLIASVVTILFVVAGGSLTLHYMFFAAVEIAAMLWIMRCALKWKDRE